MQTPERVNPAENIHMSDADSSGLKFQSSTKTLAVDDLLRIYEGIMDEADKVLAAEQIAGPMDVPSKLDDLTGYVTWHSEYNDPTPPEDITEVPDLIIGKLFSFYSSWTNYVAAAVTRAKCLRDIQKRHQDVVRSALGLYYLEEKDIPATRVKDYVNVDERYVRVDAALLQINVFYETAASREEQLRRTLNNISREQTRRASELERIEHDEKGGRGGPQGGGGVTPRRTFGKGRWA